MIRVLKSLLVKPEPVRLPGVVYHASLDELAIPNAAYRDGDWWRSMPYFTSSEVGK